MININNELSIGSFLNFGYDVTYKPKIEFDYSLILPNEYEQPSYADAKDLFMSSIEDSVIDNSDIVIPISGGLDSRALLAGALEAYESKRIKTYTFGSKGSYDYDIGVMVAKELGVDCKAYNLSEYSFSLESLTETSLMFDKQTVLFYHPPYENIKEHFGTDQFLIGFMGDPLAGSHLPKKPSFNANEILNSFFKKNKLVSSCSLYDIESSLLSDVINFNNIDSNAITIEEVMDFDIRQLKYVYPHVMPKSLDCKSPFLDPRWFKLMMSLPNTQRNNQHYYNEFLRYAFPYAFKLPCKNNLGFSLDTNKTFLKVWGAMHKVPFLRKKKTNYQDFNTRLCVDIEFKKLIHHLLIELENRDLNLKIKPTLLLKEHCERKPIYADAIITLASLEINLR